MTALRGWNFDDTGLTKLLDKAPGAAFEHFREFLFQCWLGHRITWLKTRSSRFGRGGKGVKVYKVGQKGVRRTRTVHYDLPKGGDYGPRAARRKFLELSQAEIRTDSLTLKHHETGGTTKARRHKYVTIPVAARPGDFRKWTDKFPSRAKRLKRVKRGNTVGIYEITGKRKRRARLRFVQTPSVKNEPTLMFYESWDRLGDDRSRHFRVMADRVAQALKDAANGKSA